MAFETEDLKEFSWSLLDLTYVCWFSAKSFLGINQGRFASWGGAFLERSCSASKDCKRSERDLISSDFSYNDLDCQELTSSCWTSLDNWET